MTHERTRDNQWRGLLAEQVRDHSRLFYKLAYDVVRDRAAAEDACQHALCQAWEQRDRIAEPAALKAWLARTVINHCLMVLRRKGTERRALNVRVRMNGAVQGAGRDGGAGPGDAMAVRESVMLALDELPERTRVVVTMRIMRGMSGNDTAAILGCSASEVSRRLHGGMDQLRHVLTDWKDSVGA